MSNYAVFRIQKIKSRLELIGRSKHNRRDLSEETIPDHIDRNLICESQTMGNAVKEFDRITAGMKMRRNGVIAVEAVMSFSPEMKGKIDLSQWVVDSLKWLEREFGKENLIEVSLHLDETTPHLHVIFLPRDKRGKWNWRGICPGRQGMRDLQSRYAEAVAHFGLARGEPKVGKVADYIPPAVHRELVMLRKELELAKEAGIKDSMNREKSILEMVKAFFGEEKYQAFLKWVKYRESKAKKTENLEKVIFNPPNM